MVKRREIVERRNFDSVGEVDDDNGEDFGEGEIDWVRTWGGREDEMRWISWSERSEGRIRRR